MGHSRSGRLARGEGRDIRQIVIGLGTTFRRHLHALQNPSGLSSRRRSGRSVRQFPRGRVMQSVEEPSAPQCAVRFPRTVVSREREFLSRPAAGWLRSGSSSLPHGGMVLATELSPHGRRWLVGYRSRDSGERKTGAPRVVTMFGSPGAGRMTGRRTGPCGDPARYGLVCRVRHQNPCRP